MFSGTDGTTTGTATLNLHPDHLADLRKSGLTDETIIRLGITSLRPIEIKRFPGVRSAYRLPYHDLDGAPNGFERWKLFPPLTDAAGHTQKYFQPPNTPAHLYFPRLMDWRAIAADPTIPICVSEGEKKAAMGCQSGLVTMGVGGVWNFMMKLPNGDRAVLPTLDLLAWRGRKVEIVPDSDAWPADRVHVLLGLYTLGMELVQRGAHVVLVKIVSDGKFGLDDFFVAAGERHRESFGALERLELDDARIASVASAWQKRTNRMFTVADAMETPIPLDSPDLPEFPADLFPTWASNMIEAVAVHTETPRELAAMLALASLGTACQGKFEVQPEPGYSEPLNIWTMVVMDSGNRKTAVLHLMTQPLVKWEWEKKQKASTDIARIESERETIKARIHALRQKAARADFADSALFADATAEVARLEMMLPEIPTIPQLWGDDITPEHLGQRMADNHERFAILSDEGGLFDIMAGRYNGGVPNLDIFLKSHSGSSVRVNRGSRPPIFMDHPSLTMGFSPQPSVLQGLAAHPSFRGRGLLARFLYALPVSRLGFRTLRSQPIPASVLASYAAGLCALLEITTAVDTTGQPVPYRLRFSEDAFQEWKDFQHSVEQNMREGNQFEHIKDWAGKLPGTAARIAGNFHCAQHAHSQPWAHLISTETTTHALDVVAVLAQHALAAFRLMGADPAIESAKKVWRWIERGAHMIFTARDCFDALKGTYPRMAELEPAFAVLKERRYLFEVTPTERKPGRPSRTFAVNPLLSKEWR